jgi:Carboxypeptidase regulatory-like domain
MANSKIGFSRFISLVVVVITFAVGCSVAQLFPGRITGTVRDAQGAVIPGATVKLSNPTTGLERTVTTDDTGNFNFPELALGTFRLTTTKQGFGTSVVTGCRSPCEGNAQFRTSFFNAFNHPNFAEPSPDLSTTISATADDGSFDSHFGVGGPRNIQFMGKLTW